eukprot:scaffold7676_cov100-Skeletonema_dohrnii-CCMP3373.AAC.5
MYELRQADQRTLVRFFKKRIPCYCLKKKYKEVKSVTKMSICMNSDCSHNAATVGARFGARVERSKTLRCTRCEQAFYCCVHAKKLTGLRTAKTVMILLRRKLHLQLRELCLSPNRNVIAKNARRNAFEQKDVVICNRYSILNIVSLLSDIIIEYPQRSEGGDRK